MRCVVQRFWAKVAIDPASGCWLWTGAVDETTGYGRFSTDRIDHAHRVAYAMFVGPIPAGLDLDHLCRVRRCVNPAHLEPVTRRENLLRGETLAAAHHVGRDCGFDACKSCKRFRRGAA